MNHNNYESPLSGRYASLEMQRIFSPDEKFATWRRLWVALPRPNASLDCQSRRTDSGLRAHINDIDCELAENMSVKSVMTVSGACQGIRRCLPPCKGIIHLGATSCYVVDNTDIIIMRRAMLHIRKLLISCIAAR